MKKSRSIKRVRYKYKDASITPNAHLFIIQVPNSSSHAKRLASRIQ